MNNAFLKKRGSQGGAAGDSRNQARASRHPMKTGPSSQSSFSIRWQGQIESVQCRAWVWRYKIDNRTHHHLGFNLFVKGEADDREGRFIVAVSNTQCMKIQFRIGDVFRGTAWPCFQAKHDIADYYRAGQFRALARSDDRAGNAGPPFLGLLPPIEEFQRRGPRMLDARLWRRKVPYYGEYPSIDEGWMDDLCTELRGDED